MATSDCQLRITDRLTFLVSLVIHSEAAPPKRRSCLRRLIWAALLVALLGGVCFVCRASLLTGLAGVWIVNEPVAHADAIVVLGGGIENRPFAAAKLFREGVAKQILYMNVQLGPAEESGVVLSESEVTHRILSSNGVPQTAMLMIGENVGSTYDESRAVRKWVDATGAKSLVIPTDLFHTRRVRWLFRKQFRGAATDIHVQAVAPIRYQATNWWQHEEGLVAFQNEVLKSIYYRFKY